MHGPVGEGKKRTSMGETVGKGEAYCTSEKTLLYGLTGERMEWVSARQSGGKESTYNEIVPEADPRGN